MTDDEYVNKRNKLIPQAVKLADENAGPEPKGTGPVKDAWNAIWNKEFHTQMNALARETGLVR